MTYSEYIKKKELEDIEDTIMQRIDSGEKVIIQYGGANDNIVGYVIKKHNFTSEIVREVTLETTNAIFPQIIQLQSFDDVSIEVYENALFVTVE